MKQPEIRHFVEILQQVQFYKKFFENPVTKFIFITSVDI